MTKWGLGAQAARLNRKPAPQPLPKPTGPAHPFIKWVGGKGKLLTQLLPLLPPGADLMRHVEPFIGGGALFFARAPERALIGDINPSLVATYKAIQRQADAVIDALKELAKLHSPTFYYEARTRFNERSPRSTADYAALFIYLNKTCFNGLYRVNRDNHFNVPMGRYKNPRIVDIEGIQAASRVLARADIRCDRFESLVVAARPGDFIYLDPPYAPVSATANFTSYDRERFDTRDQVRLRDLFAELARRKSRVMLSNSDVPLIRELYAKFHITKVKARRNVNSNPTKRGPIDELVIRNYG